MNPTDLPQLQQLDFLPYLDETGHLPIDLQGKIGVYAIFDREKNLQFINYSRDIFLSLKQHLVRQPDCCYWIKAQTIERPNRTLLESIREAWLQENHNALVEQNLESSLWTDPIDAKPTMTPEEIATYEASDGIEQTKLLKNVARRVEAQIKQQLELRGVQEEIRFNPKLKEKGLLDLK
ncbi:GIY-YIG nuclease family protein [Oscillatoria amoena NRMC-F 0135]|nr:GIY-YIG nuclease family protein [Geitlerinema splendidum]MDL5050015.1 GIY-YIG nuclease family protein [Oscillatoria amoena NRMC-F 0135]